MNLPNIFKIIVFDIDGTLLFRTTEQIKNKHPHFRSNGRSIYLRPNLSYLKRHQKYLSTKAKFFLWTSMLRKNATKICEQFKNMGLKFEKIYCQQQCNKDLSKDLRLIAKQHEIDVSLIYLVDDSPHKRIENQNFIQIKQYLGTDETDDEIPRIVKHLYNLLEIPFQQDVNELEQQMQKLSFNQYKYKQSNQKHKQREKKIINKQKLDIRDEESQNNKQLKYRPKLQEENDKNVMIEKNKQKNHNNKNQKKDEANRQQQKLAIKFNQNSKVIVFDLSKTLIAKKKTEEAELNHLKNNQKIQGNIIYNRPHINILQKFKQNHQHEDIKYLVWTTMTGKKVVENCRGVVNNLDATFEDVINGTTHDKGPFKDLTQVCSKYGCKIENTILIDDSPYKKLGDQNFMHVFPYSGDSNDIQMIRIAGKLDEFIKCQNPLCEIKKIVKQYDQKLALAEEDHKKKMEVANYNNKQLRNEETKLKQKQVNEIISNNKKEQKKTFLNKDQQQWQNQQAQDFKVKNLLKEGTKIKCIVFDINQTLLVRKKSKTENVKPDGHSNHYFIYLRPHLEQLKDFIEKNNIAICLWSTISTRNCAQFYKLLSDKGFKFLRLLSQEHLVEKQKNLQYVSKQIGIPVENIVLVDDNPKKKVENQNFILISTFFPENQQDDSLLELIKQLRPFVKMNENENEQLKI